MKGSKFFDTVLDDRIRSASGVLAEADRFPFRDRLKEDLAAELALYSNLKRLIATGVPPQASFPVDSQIVISLRTMIDLWRDRILIEADDLPIPDTEKQALRDTIKTGESLRHYLDAYPIR